MNTNVNQPDDAERELCPQCLEGNAPGSHFCRDCGAPLSAYAATAPFESMIAEGNVYRRAAEQPRRLIVVIGIWLIFGIGTWTGLLMAVTARGVAGGLGGLVGMAIAGVSVVIIAKTTRNYLKTRVPPQKEEVHG